MAEVYFADRYPGFDLEDPDWPNFRKQFAQVETVLGVLKVRISAGK